MEDLQAILHSIYEAALDDEVLAALPMRLARLVGGHTCTMQSMSRAGDCDLLAFNHFGPEHLPDYVQNFGATDPWALAAASRAQGSAVSLERYISSTEFGRSRIYADFIRRHGLDIRHCLGLMLPYGDGVAGVGIQRGHRGEPFGPREEELLQACSVHLRQLMLIRRRLAAANSHAGSLQAMLDSLALGAFEVSHECKVLHANEAALQLLKAGDGLRRGSSGCLEAEQREHTAQLQAEIRHAAGGIHSGAMLLSRSSGKPPLKLVIAPLTGAGRRKQGALILVQDIQQTTRATEQALRDMFGLSLREARLAVELTEGASLREVAGQWGVQASTVQTQLKRALEKTGTHRQSALVRLVGRIPELRDEQD